MQDLEMGKGPKGAPAPIARALKKQRRRGSFRLPLTVALCFVGLFFFFVIFSSGKGNTGGSTAKSAIGEGARRRGNWAAQASATRRADGEPRVFTFKVIKEFPHDPQAFTQGLQYDRICDGSGKKQKKCRDVLWESTGLNGKSTVREVELKSGKVLRSKKLPKQDFGEGLTRHGDRLYQITWMSPRTWSFAVADFEDAQLVQTPLKDGWGITSNGTHLIVGDSSERLAWLDPAAEMKSVRHVEVKDGGSRVPWLNELEFVEGLVWANIWHTDCIAQIDPGSGAVVGWAMLNGLRRRAEEAAAEDAAAAGLRGQPLDGEAVLNGIAYDAEHQRLFVTGKLWPRIYQLELQEVEGTAEAAAALQRARRHCIKRGSLQIGR